MKVLWTGAVLSTATALAALCGCESTPDAMFGAVDGTETATVTVRRDSYGVPHIFAADDYGLYYGYGYAVGEDRLYQLEILRRSTQGRVAEVLGADYAAFDQTQRSLFWPDDIRAQIADLAPVHQDILAGFADGLNHRIADVAARPDALTPREFLDAGFKPEPWTSYDIAMLFVGTMLLRFGDFNTELDNAAFLAELTTKHGPDAAKAIFDAVVPHDHPEAPTTIAASEWREARRSPIHSLQEPPDARAHAAVAGSNAQTGFSNALVLGADRLDGADAVLVNGPQFGWYVPAYTHSFALHHPDWNAVGNAPLGYPLPMFGHNDAIAWGSTWGASDNVDIFRETLNPTDPEEYRHDGAWRRFETRQETVRVKDGEEVEFTVRRSVHGPVIAYDPAAGVAYAKKRAWTGRELDTLAGWIEATRAQDHDQWRAAVARSALNVNWYFADRDGNIAYFAGGAYPERAPGHDNRLPVSGEGDMDWRGLRPASDNPQVLNPARGYIANWNNKPGAGFLNPDVWWFSWSQADRVEILDTLVDEAGRMSPEAAWDLVMDASYVDPNARYFLPHMQAALADRGDERARTAAAILSDWDGAFAGTVGEGSALSADNRYADPANALFRIWLARMMAETLSDDLPGEIGAALATDTGYGSPEQPAPSGLNISVGLKLLYEALEGRTAFDFFNGAGPNELWLTSFDTALGELEERFGADMDDWRLPVPSTRFRHTNFMNIPQTDASAQRDDLPAMNRGTENNMTVFRAGRPPEGYEIAPPGQSGFIAPDGAKDPHYEDQMDLYAAHGRRRTWLAPDDAAWGDAAPVVLSIRPSSPLGSPGASSDSD